MSMTLIQTVTVGATPAEISFTNIPQTYTDLLVVVSMRTARADVLDDCLVYFNTFNTSGQYSRRVLFGTGAAVTSTSATSQNYAFGGFVCGANNTSSTFGVAEIYIPNYTSSNSKPVSATTVNENNGTTAYQAIAANLWSSTSAITSLSVTGGGALPGQFSSATLYGITRGSGGATVS